MNRFLTEAEALRPVLHHRKALPVGAVKLTADAGAFQGWRVQPSQEPWQGKSLHTGEAVILDMGAHVTGYLHVRLSLDGTRQDAPVKLRLQFGEMPCDVAQSAADYHGWISAAWLQEDVAVLDHLPVDYLPPRRYAFRYVKVEVVAASVRFGVRVEDVWCDAVTSADTQRALAWPEDPVEGAICKAAAATLRECMQEVFEDGPKRDRRLWIGDLRLQALANYASWRNDALVKRCLYLFAGTTDPRGLVHAAVYDSQPARDDEAIMLDYALLFTVASADYWQATGDRETARALYPTAIRQLHVVKESCDNSGVVSLPEGTTAFIDWNDRLERGCALQGVYCYALMAGIRFAEAMGEADEARLLTAWLEEARGAARRAFWDEGRACFLCGDAHQRSYASQVWMVLGGVPDNQAAQALLLQTLADPPDIKMVTPYLRHYWVEALMSAGLAAEARGEIIRYWGRMLQLGADTFWELFDPDDPSASPYGGTMIHSYCHAWSCTPIVYLGKN